MSDTPHPGGRPTLYKPSHATQAGKLARLGANDEEMAEFFEVATSTFYLWKQQHPKFSEAIKRGKSEADANVADRLYQRAMGFKHKAVKIFLPAGKDEPIYAPYTEIYPPDTGAAIFWLKNRQPGKWRDKLDHEHAGKAGGPIVIVTGVVRDGDQT